MAIKFDVEITLDEEWLQEEYESFDQVPSTESIICDAINDIWDSHKFGVSLTAKNVRLESLYVGGRKDG